MNSVFREKIPRDNYELESKLPWKIDKSNINKVTHDNDIPRARKYSLESKLHFTNYKNYTIKEFMETNFNYFTWLPLNIKNFTYDKEVLKYAETCIGILEKIDNHSYSVNKTNPELGIAINQVDAMIRYEHCLDYEDDKIMLLYLKKKVNENYYRSIKDTYLERLIKQSREIIQVSSDYRRKYYNEMIGK